MAAVDQKLIFTSQKQLSLLTGNAWEALQCVRWHHNYPEGASRPFKLQTLVHAKMLYITQLYVGIYGGN